MNESIELITQAKRDNVVLEQILKDNEPMIYSLVKEFVIDGYTKEDLLQEARFAFCQAVKKFDPSKGGKLSTFAYLLIKRRLKDLKKAEQVLKRRAEVVRITVQDDDQNTPFWDIPSNHPNPEEKLLIQEQRQEVGDALRGKLSEFEFEVAILFAKGYTYADIAKLLNVGTKQVDNTLQKIRRKLKEN